MGVETRYFASPLCKSSLIIQSETRSIASLQFLMTKKLVPQLQQHHILYMLRMREHIYGLNFYGIVFFF